MDVNGILEILREQMEIGFQSVTQTDWTLAGADTVSLAVTVAVGVLFCFFGLKLIRVWGALFGLLAGGIGGVCLGGYLGLSDTVVLVISAAAGVILAVLCAWLYRFGVLSISFALGVAVSTWLLRPKDWMLFLICVGISLVVALLSLKAAEPIIMIITAIFGGLMAGTGILALLPVQNLILSAAVPAVLVIFGILVQFLLESKKRKKLHLKKAEEIRRQSSTENEVERARAIIDGLDEDEFGGYEESDEFEDYESLDEDILILNLDEEDQTVEKPKKKRRRR